MISRRREKNKRVGASRPDSGTVAQWHSGVRFTRGRSRHSVEGAVPSAYHSADIAHTPTMSAVWKYASLALLAVVSMALAPHICAMEESWVIGVEQVVGGCIFALVDLSVGNGDERRRCIAWFFVAVSVAVVRAVHPIGSAIGKILYFGHVDFAIPRDIGIMCALAVDRCSRSWSAVLFYSSASSGVCVYFGFRKFAFRVPRVTWHTFINYLDWSTRSDRRR